MSASDVKESPQALFQHCETTYKAMMADAHGEVKFDDDKQENVTIIVWEGMLTQFITGKLHLSVPYYTYITQSLKRMGCIRQLKRGGGTSPSQWQLIKEPRLEDFETTHAPRKVKQGQMAGLQSQINDLNKRVIVLETALQNIIKEEAQNG